MTGCVDFCTRERFVGWAVKDDGTPDRVVVHVNDMPTIEIAPTVDRADLDAAAGFDHSLAQPLPPGSIVRFFGKSTGRELGGSPVNIDNRLKPPTKEEMEWTAKAILPSKKLAARIGSGSEQDFIYQGTRMAGVIEGVLREFFGELETERSYLDFGCGVGRCLLPLSHNLPGAWSACDVDSASIKFLKAKASHVDSRVTDSAPPLPFDDDAFDVIYAISVWTHIPLAAQFLWLAECMRVLRPGGALLISTAGPHVADLHRKDKHVGWSGLQADDVRRQGVVFRTYGNKADLSGITSPYGLCCHDPAWIKRTWSNFATVVKTYERAIEARQDLHLLTKT